MTTRLLGVINGERESGIMGAAAADGTVEYIERVPLSAYMRAVVAFVLLVPVGVGLYVDALDGLAFGATFGCALGLAVYALQRGIFARDVRVDAEGVHLGRGTLPAGAVGDVRILPAARARDGYGGTVDGVAVSWRRNAHGGAGRWPGVLVVDRRGGRRPGWLLRSRRPEELQAAIRTVAGLSAPAPGRRAPR